jgi:hypothetical protein
LPRKADRYRGAGREKYACDKAAPQDQSTVNRCSKTNAKGSLEQDGRTICGANQEEVLKDSESMNGHRDFAPTIGNDNQ